MNRRYLAGAVTVAALAGGASAVALLGASQGARETVNIAVGDTIVPRFSIRTDSILRVAGTTIVAQRCGVSTVYLRLWRRTTQLSADTVTINVACAPAPFDTVVTSVSVFDGFGTDSTGAIVGTWSGKMTVGATRCIYVVAKNAAGQFVTGRTPKLSSTDTTVAIFRGSFGTPFPGISSPATCPDTTINPAAITWALKPARIS